MARLSPASTRIVELLDFLADHPDESFRLSEIARRVGFNKATAHGMLAVLADAGYLRRRLTALIADIAHGEHELMEIAPNRSYRTRQISAPIFDAQGNVRMGLLITGLPELPGSQVVKYAEDAVQAARRITRLVAGSDWPG